MSAFGIADLNAKLFRCKDTFLVVTWNIAMLKLVWYFTRILQRHTVRHLKQMTILCGVQEDDVWITTTHHTFLKGAGGTVVVHASLTTVTKVRFQLCAVIWLKLPWSHVRKVLSNLTLPSIAGFLRVLRFPPVVTPNPWGMVLTEPLGRTAQVADRVIQCK